MREVVQKVDGVLKRVMAFHEKMMKLQSDAKQLHERLKSPGIKKIEDIRGILDDITIKDKEITEADKEWIVICGELEEVMKQLRELDK